jgi:glycosyltransferase involved in cell wall biosynthesis
VTVGTDRPRPAQDRDLIAQATTQRILAAADVVLGPVPDAAADDQLLASQRLDELARRLLDTHDPALAWLLLTAVAGAFPTADDVHAVRRTSELAGAREIVLEVLDRARLRASRYGTAHCTMRIVEGVVVDLDACARSTFHNGIQRVARETVKVWGGRHDVTPVAWTDSAGITRALTPPEELRAAHWGRSQDEVEPLTARVDEFLLDGDGLHPELVVPWRATLVLAEVPLPDRCPALAALAQLSGTSVVAIGYDAIPIVSADLRPFGEPNAFAAYLGVVKHCTRVAGISTSATVEFAGYAHALAAQGLTGPAVAEVALPSDVPPPPPGYHRVEPSRPRVLSVGRLEPHKNHAALLHAAEMLWRSGVEFDLELIGGPGWSTEAVDAQLAGLERAGRPIRRRGSVTDDELWRAIRDASFTVFVSLHEGFGLPVSESLACGTPVVTTRYGSQGEIAAGGGCLTVDPRDDDDLARAMRDLLTNPATEQRLRAEAAARPTRTWEDYASELWAVFVDGPVQAPDRAASIEETLA